MVCFTFRKEVNYCPLAFSCPSRIDILSTISIVTTYRLPERSLIYPAAPWQKVSAHQCTEPNKSRADCISRPFFSSSVSVVLCDVDWDGKQAHCLGGALSITPSASWSSRLCGVPGSWIIPAQVADFAPRLFACHLLAWHFGTRTALIIYNLHHHLLCLTELCCSSVCECAFLSVCVRFHLCVWIWCARCVVVFSGSALYNEDGANTELFINL